MIEVVEVSYEKNGQAYFFLPNNLEIKKGMSVIVDTEKGLQYAYVNSYPKKIEEKNMKKPLKSIVRIADKQDERKHQKNIEDAKKALIYAKKTVLDLGLKIQLLDSVYTFDRDKLIFRFLSENRIDFRNLAKELATKFRTRIELRQIGARDKAKEVGGCGQCGRNLCCNKFLKTLDSVSINMAKNQNVSLNPNKINGLCGRLLCCLSYENDNYSSFRNNLPKVGDLVNTENGSGKVVEIDILNQAYKVEIQGMGLVEVKSTHGCN